MQKVNPSNYFAEYSNDACYIESSCTYTETFFRFENAELNLELIEEIRENRSENVDHKRLLMPFGNLSFRAKIVFNILETSLINVMNSPFLAVFLYFWMTAL